MINQLRRGFEIAVKAIALILIIWFMLGMLSMSSSQAYYRQAMSYIDAAQNVLIEHSVCLDKNDCSKRNILFAAGGAIKLGPFEFGGVQISLYETANADVVGDLIKALGEVYKKERGPQLKMEVYSSKHLESEIKFASVQIE